MSRIVSSVLHFTPLSGAHNEEPLCYLLEVRLPPPRTRLRGFGGPKGFHI